MQQPWWKKQLSYFVDIKIECVESRYSKLLELIYSRGRYALRTENAIYSFEDLYHNFRESFYQIPLDDFPIKNVLVLGLGLGSVPRMLERLFKKQYSYTCVDIDNEVIRLAKKYGLSDLESPVNTVCADAYEFVKNAEIKYDLVVVDLFIDDTVPSKFEKIEFLKNVEQLLTSNGILMYNRMSSTAESAQKPEDYYNSTFTKVFENAAFIVVRGNKILLNRHKD